MSVPIPPPRSTSKLPFPLGVKPTRPPPPIPPVPPYPDSTQLVAIMSQAITLKCAACCTRPALWYCVTGQYAGFYLRCGKCGCVGLSCTVRDQAAKAWNAIQTAKAIPNAALQFPGSLSAKTERELRESWARSNWGPELPSKGDTVSFEAGSMSINEVRRAEGLPAVQAGRTITHAHIEGGTVEYRDYPKTGFEANWAGLVGICGKPDTLPPKACGCIPWPSRKPFLKPLRKHWWQFRRETMASFEKRMFNAG